MMERVKEHRRAAGEGGFTLIELLVVIIILGILATVVVFAVGGVGDKGQAASCEIDTRTIRTAEEAYAAQSVDNGGGGGNYGTEAQMVPGFLSEESSLHSVDVIPDPDGPGGTGLASFTVKVQDTDCGPVGATVNGTTAL